MISIIVSFYNSAQTLKACLDAIFQSSYQDFEVIVVNDGSYDSSPQIAQNYPCRIIELNKNKGLAHARNLGASYAGHDILVFIDADVVIKKETISMISNFFIKNNNVTGLAGMLDEDCPYRDFFSQYKNLYMHFVFTSMSPEITFFYGSLHAMRASDFERYDESLPYAEDTDLGQRFAAHDKKIVLLQKLTVTHLKKHSFTSILKNDFRIPFYWAHLFFKYSSPVKVIEKKKFAHAKGGQLLSVLLAPALLCTLFLAIPFPSLFFSLSAVFFLCFLPFNQRILTYFFAKKGLGFVLLAIPFTLLDQSVMFAGIVCGSLHYFFRRMYSS